MKRFASLSLIALVAAACNSTSPTPQQQLAQLRTQRDKLNEQIAKLEAGLDSTSSNRKAIAVSVSQLQPQPFTNYIEVQGKVDAEKNVNVSAEVPAVVTAIYVKAGDHVSSGQTLAQLDNSVVRNGIAQLESQLAYAKNIYERQKNLWDQNIGTEVQLLTAKNNYENLVKQVEVQKSQLDMYRIKSPISGVVDEVALKLGQSVSPGIPTFRVVNMQDLKVVGQIGETQIGRVKTGAPVELVFPDLRDTLRTRLTYVSKVVDPVSRAFNVEIRLPHTERFHPNMLSVIRVVSYSNAQAIQVPISVIQHDNKGDYVYIARDNKAHRATVNINQTYDGMAEITEGLQDGDQLIVSGYNDVNEGDTLQIQ